MHVYAQPRSRTQPSELPRRAPRAPTQLLRHRRGQLALPGAYVAIDGYHFAAFCQLFGRPVAKDERQRAILLQVARGTRVNSSLKNMPGMTALRALPWENAPETPGYAGADARVSTTWYHLVFNARLLAPPTPNVSS